MRVTLPFLRVERTDFPRLKIALKLQKSDQRTTGENGDFVLAHGVKVARLENIESCSRIPSWRRGGAPDDHHLSNTKGRLACQELACKSARAPAPGKRLCFADSERDDFRRPQVGPVRRDENASGEPVRAAGRVWRPGPDSGGTHGSIKPSGG